MEEVYIFGHKKPDTDAVTSSIALAYLKSKLGINAKPMILSDINKETEFVLNYFDIEVPELLEDVKLQLKDVNYHKNCYVSEYDSISKTYSYMTQKNITGVPIIDSGGKFIGLLTSKMIGHELINGDFTKLNTSYNNILEVLKGEQVLKFDYEISGNVLIPNFKNNIELKKDDIVIVTDENMLNLAIESNVKLIVSIGSVELRDEYITKASSNKVNIIKTHYDIMHITKLINLANYVKNFINDARNISFNENDYYDDFKEKSVRLGHNNYPVVNNNGICLGLIRITDINKLNKKQVILVDHNDANQSVEGLDEAEILEIIDHHNLGSITTNMPINFRNMTVGSTNTIIYSLFSESNISIPPFIAGLMLSGILSDTLKFTSPTTTEYDRIVALELSRIANIDIDEYANKMFKAGTNLKGKTIDEIIQTDIKTYSVNNKKIIISQVLTLNSEDILEQKLEYIKALDNIKMISSSDVVLLSVTDILKNGSYIFFDSNSENTIASMFGFESIEEGYFFDRCLSRKKQLVPLLMSVIK